MSRLGFIWVFLAAILVISISNFAFAEQLTEFTSTLDQVDISRDGGRTWINLVNSATEFDLMALSGGSASAWFSGVRVPAGTYNKWRVHVTAYSATVTGTAYGTATDSGTTDTWDSGDMNVVVDSGGNTSAIWNFDAESSYTVHSASDIELDPQITVE